MDNKMVCKCEKETNMSGFEREIPTFSKQNYIAIANILRHYKDIDSDRFDTLIKEFSVMFEKDNQKFDKNKFYDYIYQD